MKSLCIIGRGYLVIEFMPCFYTRGPRQVTTLNYTMFVFCHAIKYNIVKDECWSLVALSASILFQVQVISLKVA